MTKKESKKTKLVKNNSKKIFDQNGKLVIPKKKTDEQIDAAVEQAQNTINEAYVQVGKKPPLTEKELKEKKRAYWRKYYSCNKEKYKQWNKNWRQSKTKKVKLNANGRKSQD